LRAQIQLCRPVIPWDGVFQGGGCGIVEYCCVSRSLAYSRLLYEQMASKISTLTPMCFAPGGLSILGCFCVFGPFAYLRIPGFPNPGYSCRDRRGEQLSLRARAQHHRESDAISDGPGTECIPRKGESCPTLAVPAASLIAPPSRALQPARPVRELLYATVSSGFCKRGPLGPRGSHRCPS
jgi:hypothetical protein